MPDRPTPSLLSAFDDRRIGVVYTLALLLVLVRWFQTDGTAEPLLVLLVVPVGLAVRTAEARYSGTSLLGVALVAALLFVAESGLLPPGTDGLWLSGVAGFLLGYLLAVLQRARGDEAHLAP